MRLNEQRDRLIDGIAAAGNDIMHLRSAILRKMAAPYGDGSRSNMVNAETDVLPRLTDILDKLTTTLEDIGRDPDAKPTGNEPQSVRVW